MGLRPAKTIREIRGQPWCRISKRKPRKSFVKGAPRPKVRQYNMGTDKRFELEVDVVPNMTLRIRDNAIEAARQATNKYLEKTLMDNYFLQVVSYPHLVVREHSALGVAGADRISKGMKRAFGKPKGRMAQVKHGDPVLRARIMKKDLPALKEGFKRGTAKLTGGYTLIIEDITNNSKNLARSIVGRKMKKKEEAPKPEAAAVPGAAPAAGATPAAGKEGEKTPAPTGKEAEKAPAKK